MKKLAYLLCLTTVMILFSSCISFNRNTIVGAWRVVQYHDIEYQNGKQISNQQSAPLDRTDIIFSRRGTMQMQQVGNGFNYSMTGYWKMNGRQLTITDTQKALQCSAIVSGNSLVMSYAVEQRVNGVTYRYVTEMAAKRQ